MKALIFAAVCSATLAFNASAQNIKQAWATVVRIEGEARYSLGDGKWHPLNVGKTLTAGAVVQTAHNGMVDMVLGKQIQMPQAHTFPDRISYAPDPLVRGLIDYKPAAEQNMIRLTEDTTLAIDKLTISDTGVDTVSDTELDLKSGKIFASVKKLSAASQYLIKIPNGIAGVRGTLLGIGADGWCGCSRNSVMESLTINGVLVTVVINQGFQLDPANGQVIPLTSDLIQLLSQISTALDTLYVEIVSFTYDTTFCHISPVNGHYPHVGFGFFLF
jgi:FecR protein